MLEAAGVALPIQVVDVSDGAAGARLWIVLGRLPQGDDPLGVVIGQRAQQHSVDDAEERRGGADAKSEGENGDRDERGAGRQRAKGDSNVLKIGIHGSLRGKGRALRRRSSKRRIGQGTRGEARGRAVLAVRLRAASSRRRSPPPRKLRVVFHR